MAQEGVLRDLGHKMGEPLNSELGFPSVVHVELMQQHGLTYKVMERTLKDGGHDADHAHGSIHSERLI